MKLTKISALCLAASTLFTASSAMAWESGDHSTSASVALGTDYMWRGASQSQNNAAISGSFDYAHASGFYAGTWASNVDFNSSASAEVDLYAGFGSEFGETGIGYDVSVLRYIYPTDATLNWNEYLASLSYSYFTVGIGYSADVFNTEETGVYYSLGFDYDLPMDVALSAGVGYYDFNKAVWGAGNPDSAVDYHIGVSKEMAGFGFDLTYIDSDKDAGQLYGKSATDGRVVFTISKSM